MLFKDMTDAGLIEAYWATRALVANADGIASMHAQVGAKRLANKGSGQVLRQLKNLDIIVAIARKRGLKFTPKPETK